MKHKIMLLLIPALVIGFSIQSFAGPGNTMYVQALKTKLKKAPKMGAANVTELKRGDKLTVLKKKSIWFNVKVNGKTGWISKLFVNTKKPIGHATLANALDGNPSVAKASRRRSASYTVSAATRGLTANTRVREGRDKYHADFTALRDIELYEIDQQDLDSFTKSARLGTY